MGFRAHPSRGSKRSGGSLSALAVTRQRGPGPRHVCWRHTEGLHTRLQSGLAGPHRERKLTSLWPYSPPAVTAAVPRQHPLFSACQSPPGNPALPSPALSPSPTSFFRLQQLCGARQTDRPGSTPAGTRERCNCRDVTWLLCLVPQTRATGRLRTATPVRVQCGDRLVCA